MHAVGDTFPFELAARCLRRRKEPPSEVIRHDPVYLLGHAAIEAAKTSLDVSDRYLELRRSQRASKSRVRVAVHKDSVGGLGCQHAFDAGQHCASLLAV